MPLDILIPMILVPLLIVGGLTWYRRTMRRLEPDAGPRELTGARLTSEHLRRLPTPPWRVIYQIGDDRLGGVDHVVIGPPGVVAVTTVMSDRPGEQISLDPTLVGAAAVLRGTVDDLLEPVGLRGAVLAKVFWGDPQPDRPAAVENPPGSVAVVGQRLDEWLTTLPADALSATEVELAWAALTTGIGRPDPRTSTGE